MQTTITSLKERFLLLEAHRSVWGFLYSICDQPSDIMARCMKLQQALTDSGESDVNGRELCEELKQRRRMLPPEANHPQETLQYIEDLSAVDLFPNLWVNLRILLYLPVSVAGSERRFSKLKTIKNYLRSTADDRLSSLAVLSIEHEVTKSLELDDVLSEFALKKARRAPFHHPLRQDATGILRKPGWQRYPSIQREIRILEESEQG